MKNTKSQNEGITLIALVITIIVLLILVGVVIATLTGENGILNRTQETTITNKLGEAKEKCALIATDAFQEYYNEAYVKNSITYSEEGLNTAVVSAINAQGQRQMPTQVEVVAIDASGSDTAKVVITYAKDTSSVAQASVTGTIASGRITWGEIKYDAKEAEEARKAAEEAEVARQAFIETVNEAIKAKKDDDSKVTPEDLKDVLTTYFTEESMATIEELDLTDSTVQSGTSITATTTYNSYTVTISELLTGVTVENAAPSAIEVDFGSKTAATIEVGEDLTIGTEQFRVVRRDSFGFLVAMPFYNITLVTPEDNDGAYPEQTDADSGNTTEYSTDKCWTSGADFMLMENSKIKIQKYITAYSSKLSTITGGKVTAQVALITDLRDEAISLPSGSAVTKNQIRNPGQKGPYWTGSDKDQSVDSIRAVNSSRHHQRLLL